MSAYDGSRPSRARGLKQIAGPLAHALDQVAPITGAWVETFSFSGDGVSYESRPSRARGLKHAITGAHRIAG